MTTIQKVSCKILDMYSSQPTATHPTHAEFTSVSITVEDQELPKTTTVSFNMPPQTISLSSTLSQHAGIQVRPCLLQTQKHTSLTPVSIPSSSRTSCAAFSMLLTTAVKQELMSVRALQLWHLLLLLWSPLFGWSSDVTKLIQFNYVSQTFTNFHKMIKNKRYNYFPTGFWGFGVLGFRV